MKLNRIDLSLFKDGWLKKCLRIMKLTSFFILVLTLQMSASVYSQTTTLSVKLKNSTLQELFLQIEKNSTYRFFYNNDEVDVSQRISVDAEEKTVGKILEVAFVGLPYSFKELDNKLILIERNGAKSNPIGATMQQQKSVSGKVTDEAGQPLPGVTVVIKGTTKGTVTSMDGGYSVSNLSAGAILQFSFIGMLTQEIEVGTQNTINISMKLDAIGIEEVVAVGYGTNKKMNLTGSIVTINDKELNTATTTNITDKLTGKLPGLRVMQRTSEPGNYDSKFDIRGWGNPLIIVDGIERGVSFNKIDPNEVESITVLKDASAAIYGVKAANGVILVTTKKGKVGSLDITYSGTYGIKEITEFPKPMTAAQFTESFNWALVNGGQPIEFSQKLVDSYKNGEVQGTNWQELAMNNTAPQQQHNLSFSGGNDKIKFFTSLGFIDDKGLFKAGDLNYARYNVRSNIEAKLTKNLTAELQIGAIADKKESPSYWIGGIFKGLWMQRPTYSVYANETEPFYQNMPDGNHPLVVTNSDLIGSTDSKNKAFQGTLSFNYDLPFVDGLSAKFLYAYDANHYNTKGFNRQYNLYDYMATTTSYNASGNNTPSKLDVAFEENEKSTMQVYLNYDKIFGENHHVKGLFLYENINVANDNLNGSRKFAVDAIEELYAGNSTQFISSDANRIFETNNQGIVGRLNYDYHSKYLVEASFRYDGSSMFPKGKRWGFFPSASVGWRISDESFIKDNIAIIDNLKIRASYGKLGDDAAARYQFVSGYVYPTSVNFNGRPLGGVFGGNFVAGLSPVGMVNPNITWFTATTANVGFDGSLWQNKLTFSADIFQRNRDGLLATRLLSLPQSVGASLPQENLNSDISRGFEIQIGTTQKINDITINLSGMMSFAKNKWDYKEEAIAGNSYLKWRNSNSGRYTNIIWGLDYSGQYQNQEEINKHLIINGQRYILPGDYIFKDANNDGMLSEWDDLPIAKGTADMGSQAIPEINYGFNMSLKWKDFDMSVLFQGATNYSVMLIEQLQNPYPWGRNGLSHFYDSWHRADFNNPNSEWIPGKYPPSRIGGVNWSNRTSAAYNIKDASYLRLKSMEVGYTLPTKYISKIGIKNCRLFANGFNLLTWSKLDFMDPEHPQDQYGYMYPLTRNMNLGVNVSF